MHKVTALYKSAIGTDIQDTYHAQIFIHLHLPTHVYIHMHTHTHTLTYCMHTYLHTCTCTHLYWQWVYTNTYQIVNKAHFAILCLDQILQWEEAPIISSNGHLGGLVKGLHWWLQEVQAISGNKTRQRGVVEAWTLCLGEVGNVGVINTCLEVESGEHKHMPGVKLES